jgi:hypothetical protein
VREAALGILIREVILALNYEKQRKTPTLSIRTNNRCRLYSITWLDCLASVTSICACNDYSYTNNSYHKPCLVEVVEIGVEYPVFRIYILN